MKISMSICIRIVLAFIIYLAADFEFACAQSDNHLQMGFGDRGLASLTYDGQEFLAAPQAGAVYPVNNTPTLQQGNDVVMVFSKLISSVVDKKRFTIKYTYDWALIICSYETVNDALRIKIQIHNADSHQLIKKLTLEIANLTFPEEPTGRTLEAGMWGTGGVIRPLHLLPQTVFPDQAPPIVEIRTPNTALVFASDDVPSEKRLQSMGVPFTTDQKDKRSYPLWVTIKPLPPGADLTINVSIRFGSGSADLQNLAGDVLQTYARTYPFELSWPSHAPIGALFLAASQPHTSGNPRGWFSNAKDLDVTTLSGLRDFHDRLMTFADNSIRVLKDMGAQGMITWDPEGQEYPNATFYGAPQLTPKLAPETEFARDGMVKTIDEYFAKFRTAGLRTGVTIRPQHIVFRDELPVQRFSEEPLSELESKVRYARERWGCTLFYIDSTYDMSGVLSADIMKSLHEENPDVLLIPEHEDFRYFAYTAALNSFNHQSVTSTPPSVREVYKKSFSVLLASLPRNTPQTEIKRLIQAVENGDIMLVNAWYPGFQTELVKKIYNEANSASTP